MTKSMKPPLLLLPSCNYVEVDCEYAMHVAANMPCTLQIHILIHCRCLLLLLPSWNDVEVDCENAMYAAETRTNTLLLPTAISLLLYRYY